MFGGDEWWQAGDADKLVPIHTRYASSNTMKILCAPRRGVLSYAVLRSQESDEGCKDEAFPLTATEACRKAIKPSFQYWANPSANYFFTGDEQPMELPNALSTNNPAHADTIYKAIEASTQSPLEDERKPAEKLLRACESIPGYMSVLASIVGTHAAAPDARVGAVIILKNMVRVHWNSRGGRGYVVSNGEKAALKGFLLSMHAMEEPQEKVASQLAVLMGKVARQDWPRMWPELFPALVASLMSGGPARRRVALCGIDEVLRELSTKRVGFDKAAFHETANDLLPVLCQAWDGQWTEIERFLASAKAVDVDSPATGTEAIEVVALGTVCIKIIRRVLEFGIPRLEHPQVEPFFHALFHRMATVLQALQRHETSAATTLAGTEAAPSVVEEMQELAERMAGVAVDAQKEHPIGFGRYLGAYLSFFCEQLHSAACVTAAARAVRGGSQCSPADISSAETGLYPFGLFCIRCMTFLANTVSCSSYRGDVLQKAVAKATPAAGASSIQQQANGRLITAKGDAVVTAEIAGNILTVISDFFTAERSTTLLRLLLEAYLPMTTMDVNEWRDSPEQYYLLQESLEARESLRVSAQHLYMALLEAGSENDNGVVAGAVAKMLTESVGDQLEACRHTTVSPQVLACDALYLCAGLGACTVKRLFNFEDWFHAFLAPAMEALVATMLRRDQESTGDLPPLVLLRRIMWLLGCWAEQIPTSLRPPLVQATANVMKTPIKAVLQGVSEEDNVDRSESSPDQSMLDVMRCQAFRKPASQTDVMVRLSALHALQAVLALWDLDAEQSLAPALGWLIPALYGLFTDLEEMDTRQQVLTVMSELLERSGTLIVPHCQAAVAGLPGVWNDSASQTPLRCSCLQVMVHVLNALGSAKSLELDEVALSMVKVSTEVGSDDAVYLMGAGLELWLALLRHAKEYSENYHLLFPRIAQMLEDDLDHLKQAMLITEAYFVLGGTLFLQSHSPCISSCFRRVVGQVKPQGAAFVSRALETALRKSPAAASRMLLEGGITRKLLEASMTFAGDDEDHNREPDLVIVQHLTILARVFLGVPENFGSLLQEVASSRRAAGAGAGVLMIGADEILSNMTPRCSCDFVCGLAGLLGVRIETVQQMTSLFDSAGYSDAGVSRRRLWAIALLRLLPSGNNRVLEDLDQIVNICVDVLTEEREDERGRNQKEALDASQDKAGHSTSSATSLLQARLKEIEIADVAVTTDVRMLVRTSMDALREKLGDAKWRETVDNVEPVVLKQLRELVA